MLDSRLWKVLVIDPEESTYTQICETLSTSRAARFSLEWVSSYAAGVATLALNQYDAYLIDAHLEGDKGIELLREAVNRGYRAPVILLTQAGDESLITIGIKLGAADNIDKSELGSRILEKSLLYTIERVWTLKVLSESEKRHRELFDQTQQALAKTKALYQSTLSLTAFRSLGDVLQAVVDDVVEALPANRSTMIHFDLKEKNVMKRVMSGPGKHYLREVTFNELWGGLSGWVLRELKPALSPKGIPDPRESPEVQQIRQETNCGSIIVVPVMYQNTIMGTMSAMNLPDERDFTQWDVELMVAMANQAAVAIENARLFQELRDSEERLRTTLTAAPIILLTVDKDGFLQLAEGKGLESMKIQSGDLVNQPIEQVFANIPDLLGYARRALDGERFSGQVNVGRRTWEGHVSPQLGSDGVYQGSIIVATDVTDHKTLQNELNNRVIQLTTLRMVDAELNRKLDFRYVLDIALDVAVRLSGADAGFIGLVEEDDYLQIQVSVGTYPPHLEHLLNAQSGIWGRVLRQRRAEMVLDVASDPDYVRIIETTRAQITIPLISRHKLIGVLSLETHDPGLYSEEVFDFLKLLTARVAVAIDNAQLYHISQTQLAELEARNRELDAYSYTIAHDLKAPLNVSVFYASLLLRQYADSLPPEAQAHLQGIKNSALHMARMIDQLLKLAQLRDASAAAEPVEIAPVVEAALGRFTDRLSTGNIAVEVQPDLPVALGHAPWIEEVFANLIGNAIKYMGEQNPQPSIRIRGKVEEDFSRFEVADSGIGIAPENQARLFEMFTRVQDIEADGLGLGLSIVHRIVTKLKGRVGVESEQGKGSTFWFLLPATTEMAS